MPERLVNGDADQLKTTEVTVGLLSAALTQGLRSECAAVWLDRGAYERAESRYYARLQECQNGTTAPASTSSSGSQRNREACRHEDQEACHHMVQTVWVNKPVFDQAESRFEAQRPKRPNSANAPSFLQLLPNSPSSSALHDEGYISQSPTPHTPASKPVNGLPFLPAPLQGVWLQKTLYDRAEASFYQNLYRQNELGSKPVAVDEEPADLRVKNGTDPKETKLDKAEEAPPHDGAFKKERGAVWHHFLHADSERVWLDRSRYAEAENRFYEAISTKTIQTAVVRSSSSLKYDLALCILTHSH